MPWLQVGPELHTHAAFSHIQFSADGKLMLCVAEGHVYQLDAYNGNLPQTYSTGVPRGALGLGAVFSPDSNYILSGRSLLAAYFCCSACDFVQGSHAHELQFLWVEQGSC